MVDRERRHRRRMVGVSPVFPSRRGQESLPGFRPHPVDARDDENLRVRITRPSRRQRAATSLREPDREAPVELRQRDLLDRDALAGRPFADAPLVRGYLHLAGAVFHDDGLSARAAAAARGRKFRPEPAPPESHVYLVTNPLENVGSVVSDRLASAHVRRESTRTAARTAGTVEQTRKRLPRSSPAASSDATTDAPSQARTVSPRPDRTTTSDRLD